MAPYNPAANDGGEGDLECTRDDGSVYGVLRHNNEKSTVISTSTLEVDYDTNITDLYQAITSCDWDGAIDAATKHPEQARTWVVRHYEDSETTTSSEVMWRFLPIHSASARQPPREVLSALLKAYPDGAKCVDDQGMYALHYACGNQAHRDVVRMLLVAYPEAASMQDPNGMLPLHYLACWGPSESSILDMVLAAYRQAGNARDADGNTPLDLAMDGDYEERDQVVTILKKWQSRSSSSSHSHASHESSRQPSVSTHLTDNKFPAKEKREDDSFNAREVKSQQSMASNSGSPSTPFLVGRLKDEIAVLKERLKESKWELSEKKNMETESTLKQRVASLEKKVSRQQDELELTREELDEVQIELETKDEALKKMTSELEETKIKLKEALEERAGLRITLTDLMDKHDSSKKQTHFMNDRLGSLSASLSSMMDQHKTVLKAMRDREETWKKSALDRQKQLEVLMSIETEIETDQSLEAALNKTNKEMEAISAVIAAARASF